MVVYDENKEAEFDYDWLTKEDYQFKLLALLAVLADNKLAYRGTLADMRDFLGISGCSKNNRIIKDAIDALETDGLVKKIVDGRTFTLTLSKKAEKQRRIIRMKNDWVMVAKNYAAMPNKTESVAWDKLLKVWLFLLDRNNQPNKSKVTITNKQIAEALGLAHVEYGLEKFKGRLCSTCPLFTSERIGFVPAGRLVSRNEALQDPRFADIFFFDAIIFNTDRHLGNFGYLIDNDTNEIVGAAPIFDNGYGLFSLAMYKPGHRYDEYDDLRKFVGHITPALYDRWLGFPGAISPTLRARLANLKGFRFKRHKYYNLPVDRLRRIEDFLQNRVAEILEYGDKADDFLKISGENDSVNHVSNESCALQIKENLKADPFITYAELADLLQISPSSIARKIKALQESGEIRRVGADKNGYWDVLDR